MTRHNEYLFILERKIFRIQCLHTFHGEEKILSQNSCILLRDAYILREIAKAVKYNFPIKGTCTALKCCGNTSA